jgi:hypothetical protein
MRLDAAAVACVVFLGATSVGVGQNSTDVLSQPWQPGPHWAETVDDVLFFESGHTKNSNYDTEVFFWDSFGRIRFNRVDNDPRWTVGYRLFALGNDSGAPPINGDFWDIAVALGYKFDRMANGWRFSVLAGAGTANDSHFSNTHALYGVGIVSAERALDENRTLRLGVMYNGNALLLPDAPMPYVAYEQKVSEQLQYTLGLPASGLDWRPLPALSLNLDYIAPVTAKANLSFWFSQAVGLFAEVASATDGFYIEDAGNRRLFYRLNRATAGVRWITKWADLRLGAGYAFNQQFTRGFDLRDTHNVARLSDEPFISLRVHGTF